MPPTSADPLVVIDNENSLHSDRTAYGDQRALLLQERPEALQVCQSAEFRLAPLAELTDEGCACSAKRVELCGAEEAVDGLGILMPEAEEFIDIADCE
jgi:hypothetical protein